MDTNMFVQDAESLKEQLKRWNNTSFTHFNSKPLPALVEEQAAMWPDKLAVSYLDKQFTYKQLDESANQLARLFLSYGIKKGDVVGLAMDRCEYIVVAMLAILKVGAAYVPIDLEYPKQRIDFMLKDAEVKLLFTSRKYAGLFQSQASEILLEDALKKIEGSSTESPGVDVNEKDLAYIIYTSGTTGTPKGVMIEQGSFVNLLCSMQQKEIIDANDKLLSVTTIAFDIAGLELFLPLITGAQLIITDDLVCRDGFALLETIKKLGITIIQATPLTYKMILAAGWQEKLNLKILCCGEAMSMTLAKDLLLRCSKLYNYYGPTETTIYSTGAEIFAEDKEITIGKPIGNTQVYILDDGMNLLPPGKEGVIYIAGKGLARGYKNMPELTEASFVRNLFSEDENEKMFRTGDVGKWTADGNIYFMGRIDQQLKIRGYRIEPATIEAVLISQTEIADVVVIAREDVPDNKTLVAYIVLKKDKSAAPIAAYEYLDKWKEAVQEKLPLFMIPNDFVVLEKFPLLLSGKIDRKALPKPDKNMRGSDKRYVAPASETEKIVAAMWAGAFHNG